MTKRVCLMCALCVIIFITGCIDSSTVISVRKDGSGTITEVVYMDESVMSMFEGMMPQMGEESEEKEESAKDALDIEKYKTKAAELGTGVKFVSAKEVINEEGTTGIQVIYSFDDIQKLNIQAEPENPMGDQMAGMMGAESTESKEDENPITFEFIKGSTPKLIVKMPKEEESEPESEPSEEPSEETTSTQEASAQGMAMMKQFLTGFRIKVVINFLEGKIQKTNASFVEQIKGKDTVTLLDVALGEIMNNEKYAKEWEQMSQMKNIDNAMEMMKKIPGLKIETAERVEISFK
jgi:hypothetical protein